MSLIGAGGVMTPFEAKAMRNAGAHLVQVYSAFIYEGPGVVKRIAEKI
jgi:dihydroorotate dehydrogenase